MSLSIKETYLPLKACVDQCNHFRKHGKYYQGKHLYCCLETVKEKEDEEGKCQILTIIQQEKDRSFWRRLNYALGKPQGGACFKVHVEQVEDTVKEINSKEELPKAIWDNVHRKQFYLAKESPICSGQLRGALGYNSITPTVKAILEETYNYPPEFDEATNVLQKCALIQLQVPKNSISTTITPVDWSNHWRSSREETSQSISGWHFGHYKAGLQSQYVSYLQALQVTLVVKWGIVLERWSNGLSFMLEKIFGCSLITKLGLILLIEANLNATNKVVYGVRMLANVRKYRLVPEEMYSERSRLADDGTLPRFSSMTLSNS
jgi:hypothetical protein